MSFHFGVVDQCICSLLGLHLSLSSFELAQSHNNGLLENIYVLCALVHTYPQLRCTYNFVSSLITKIKLPKSAFCFQLLKYNSCLTWLEMNELSAHQVDLNVLKEERSWLVEACREDVQVACSSVSLAALSKLHTNNGILSLALDKANLDGSRTYTRQCTKDSLYHFETLSLDIPLIFETNGTSLDASSKERVLFLTHIVFVGSEYGTREILWYRDTMTRNLLSWEKAFHTSAQIEANVAVYCEIVSALFQLGVDVDSPGSLHFMEQLLQGKWRPLALDSYSIFHDIVCCLMILCHW